MPLNFGKFLENAVGVRPSVTPPTGLRSQRLPAGGSFAGTAARPRILGGVACGQEACGGIGEWFTAPGASAPAPRLAREEGRGAGTATRCLARRRRNLWGQDPAGLRRPSVERMRVIIAARDEERILPALRRAAFDPVGGFPDEPLLPFPCA